MELAILHLGNIANNAYNNAKYLNRNVKGLRHNVLNFDNPHVMASPQWEEIDSLLPIDEFAPSWPKDYEGYPAWYTYLETSDLDISGTKSAFKLNGMLLRCRRRLAYWLKDQGLEKRQGKLRLPVDRLGKIKVFSALPVYLTLHAYAAFKKKLEWHQYGENCSDYHLLAKKLKPQLEQYSLIQAYGADIIIPYLLGIPYIAYEHGTLRELPFLGNKNADLLQQAYKHARHVVITNPDVLPSANKLAIKNITFIPHAVDTERFLANDDTRLHQHFNITPDDLVILAPARQNWDIKSNDKVIRAFAKLVKTEKQYNFTLMLCDWGQHRDKTRDLIKQYNINKNVTFYPPVPKKTSAKMMQMADIVVDQFKLGTFGGITPEAMSCGKPLLVHYQSEIHEWCFNSHPPVLNATNSDDIYRHFKELASSKEYRQELGEKGRAWVQQEYSVNQLVERHQQIYKLIENHL